MSDHYEVFKNLLLIVSGVLVIRALLLSIDSTNEEKIENKVSVQDKKRT
ncbi:hypothetical protein SD304_13355 [Staphylococcus nepalensis]|nr:hypothetical protein [Staphylococcus nepalensis]